MTPIRILDVEVSPCSCLVCWADLVVRTIAGAAVAVALIFLVPFFFVLLGEALR